MVANMTDLTAHMLGAFGFLVMGRAGYLAFARSALPAMSEKPGTNETGGPSTSWIPRLVQIHSFVLMPVIGWFLGGRIIASLAGLE